jgi:4-amino-4-deoxy-L-arabinose transferase-like glycosyltransferase
MTPPQARFRAWAIAGALAAAVGIAMRVHNAFAYPLRKGFDAAANWEYVALLLERWQLPDPATLWAASHPPLFYWLGGAVGRLLGGDGSEAAIVPWIRIVGSLLGLAAIGWGWQCVRKLDANPRRQFFVAAVPLLLPVHIYTSAMLNEEIVAAAFTTFALVALLHSRREASSWHDVALVGLLAGLAILTKVSGILVLAAAAATYLVDGWRRGELAAGFARAAVVSLVGALVGGWFFAHNLAVYGYIYPYKLDVHAIMATMPPGERTLFDYVYVPLATVFSPVVLGPELVRSVWGGTYATLWFDAHHHFLPRPTPALVQWGAALTVLGLVPTTAFVVGVVRAVRRVRRGTEGADLPLLLTLLVTLTGYVAFTFRNPWFPTAKASYLLGLSFPFAYYASEVLADWTRPERLWGAVSRFWLGFLAVLVILTFSHGLLFAKHDDPGVQWKPLPPSSAG